MNNSSINNTSCLTINGFIEELMSVSSNDILINLKSNTKEVFSLNKLPETSDFEIQSNALVKKIFHYAIKQKKNYDIHPLCIASHHLIWTVEKNEFKSPIVLYPLRFSYQKFNETFKCSFNQNQFFLNPFLLATLKKEFSLEFLSQSKNEAEEELNRFLNFLKEQQFPFYTESSTSIGNFHYHRYEILKELEEISSSEKKSSILEVILGNEEKNEKIYTKFDAKNLARIDPDQLEVLNQIENNSVIVQGPPGTGKSHLLCSILGKLLHCGGKQLMLAEKKTALEVIYNKMKDFSLDRFVFISHYNTKNSEFIEKLKSNWKFLEKQQTTSINVYYSQIPTKLHQLQLFFDWYQQQDLFKHYTIKYLVELEKTTAYIKAPFLNDLPSYSNWKYMKEALQIHKNNPSLFPLFSFIKIKLHKENSTEVFHQLQTIYTNFCEINEHIPIDKIEDVKSLVKNSIYTQLYQNEHKKAYFQLLLTETKRNNLINELLKWQKVDKELELWKEEIKHWKNTPSISLLESISSDLKNKNPLNLFFVKRKYKKYLKDTQIDLTLLCKNTLQYLKIHEKVLKMEQKLFSLGITEPKKEGFFVLQVCKQIDCFPSNLWSTIIDMDPIKRKKISENSQKIKNLEQNLSLLFYLEPNTEIKEVLENFIQHFSILFEHSSTFQSIHSSVLACIRKNFSIEEIDNMVIKKEWLNLQVLFPQFTSINSESLRKQFDAISTETENEKNHLINEIIQKKVQKMNEFHSVLRKPSAQLSPTEKELKQKLKDGKKILVKEFSKQKAHKGIKELLQSDAKLWIEILCPIFLSTSSMVSKNFPLQTSFFEYLLIDESSQMLLPRAIGALFRSKKVVVAGDEHQMSPSSYFKGKTSSIDLLHQSSYYLKKIRLRHHYRSKNPSLIQFSNQHFYQNELLVYPSFPIEKQAIQWTFCQDGVYENRQNINEAKELSTRLKGFLFSEKKIGVVCFSEQQLSCVFSLLSAEEQNVLLLKMKKNTLFFKSLEQVQGEECDVLLISFAYGKDENGKFYQHFGPLNHLSGAKRLNVLFTRAKEQIYLYTSVNPNDFPISCNESVNLFRLYLLDLALNKESIKSTFIPYPLEIKVEKNIIQIFQPFKSIKNAREFYVFDVVMKERKWSLDYLF
ncbi:MAG: ATP-binding protein [Flavobacteriia bacterium]|nr:ATP-binding protein [Flavobacteriia bacterium]